VDAFSRTDDAQYGSSLIAAVKRAGIWPLNPLIFLTIVPDEKMKHTRTGGALARVFAAVVSNGGRHPGGKLRSGSCKENEERALGNDQGSAEDQDESVPHAAS
jgi:hypothetical protein